MKKIYIFDLPATEKIGSAFGGGRHILYVPLQLCNYFFLFKTRLAFVGYGDFGDSPQFQVLNFTASVDEFHKFCAAVTLTNGYDAAEDVFGGLEKAIALNWTTGSISI